MTSVTHRVKGFGEVRYLMAMSGNLYRQGGKRTLHQEGDGKSRSSAWVLGLILCDWILYREGKWEGSSS